MRVTHRFHPLFGREFEFVVHRQNWGEDRVHVRGEDGRLFSLPAGWTDAGPVDPFEMVRRVEVEGVSVTAAAAAFGFSRPAYYQAAAALAACGLEGLVPDKPGPRGGHKLTDEVLDWAQDQLAADPTLRPGGLVEPIAAEFGVRVHRRTIERALTRRQERSKSP